MKNKYLDMMENSFFSHFKTQQVIIVKLSDWPLFPSLRLTNILFHFSVYYMKCK